MGVIFVACLSITSNLDANECKNIYQIRRSLSVERL
jgi:hypothetical protein